jgi:hypothetical protein
MKETDISKVLIEGEYATIMGVKYKRVGEPKPQKLYHRLYDELGYDFEDIENVVDLVDDWLPLEGCHELKSYDYSAGWNDCIKAIRRKLR